MLASTRSDAGNLAAVLLAMRGSDAPVVGAAYRRIVAVVRQVAPFFRDFVLEPENDRVRLRWRQVEEAVVNDLLLPHFQQVGWAVSMSIITTRRTRQAVAAPLPDYMKTIEGPLAVAALGVAGLRAKCPHGDEWLRSLSA
ncbi:hypothetical protein [Actinokineospora inagensis]|uniref:hypothetical protein n=1 Tax=Actinokineospora inagensis TaxID=103730 RepID=UPI0003F5F70C|nr:hypothetical protein [Actinokineospora inagensis]